MRPEAIPSKPGAGAGLIGPWLIIGILGTGGMPILGGIRGATGGMPPMLRGPKPAIPSTGGVGPPSMLPEDCSG